MSQTFRMVKTNNKAKAKSSNNAGMTEGTIPHQSEDLDFEIDPELLEPGHNQVRRPILPYGIVINEQVAGILIPEDQLEKSQLVCHANRRGNDYNWTNRRCYRPAAL